MKYDFVEIGTSNFSALIETAAEHTRGISVEPIRTYLDQLPSPAGVLKLQCAVSRKNKNETLEVYYVPESVIHQHGLPSWLRGCNSVGEYHFQHVALNIQSLVQVEQVPCVPIGQLFEDHDITELDLLKIDTEGADCDIMMHLYAYLARQPFSRYPRKIMFESNELSVPAQVELVKRRFMDLGYRVTQAGYDTVLEISST
jgi:FkbM family methyltransferase